MGGGFVEEPRNGEHLSRSSSSEVSRKGTRFVSVVYFSRGTLPTKKKGEKGHLAGGPSFLQEPKERTFGREAFFVARNPLDPILHNPCSFPWVFDGFLKRFGSLEWGNYT